VRPVARDQHRHVPAGALELPPAVQPATEAVRAETRELDPRDRDLGAG
jgi:hypothetical protein